MSRLLAFCLLALFAHVQAAKISSDRFLDMCEAHGRVNGRLAADEACDTVVSVCQPSTTSSRGVFYEDPYFDSLMIDVMRDSCELLYQTMCRKTAHRAAKRKPLCSKILKGAIAFGSPYCPDLETALDIFEDTLGICDEVPSQLLAVLGIGKPSKSQRSKDNSRKPSNFGPTFFRSSLGRALKKASLRPPAQSGQPNDPCDCTDKFSAGQKVSSNGCEDGFCYVVGKECELAFPSARHPGAYMRLCPE